MVEQTDDKTDMEESDHGLVEVLSRRDWGKPQKAILNIQITNSDNSHKHRKLLTTAQVKSGVSAGFQMRMSATVSNARFNAFSNLVPVSAFLSYFLLRALPKLDA